MHHQWFQKNKLFAPAILEAFGKSFIPLGVKKNF